MPRVHFLNVGDGDCSIIQHESGNVSMIDICNGNTPALTFEDATRRAEIYLSNALKKSNFNMKELPTDPIAYCQRLGIGKIFRFILTHPDMDHLDGLHKLFATLSVLNFWEPGIRRPKSDFSGDQFNRSDWDLYHELVAGTQKGVNVLSNLAGSEFEFANKGGFEGRGDGLIIVAPNKGLVDAANASEDINDGSYVIVYQTIGGNIIFAGDSHDDTWDYILAQHKDLVSNCAVLIAPHHGRDSNRIFEFLDILKPKLTLFGVAPSEHLAYEPWNNRNLLKITNNQAGNVVLDITDRGIEIFLQNRSFAETWPYYDSSPDLLGHYSIGMIKKPQPILDFGNAFTLPKNIKLFSD